MLTEWKVGMEVARETYHGEIIEKLIITKVGVKKITTDDGSAWNVYGRVYGQRESYGPRIVPWAEKHASALALVNTRNKVLRLWGVVNRCINDYSMEELTVVLKALQQITGKEGKK